MESIIILVVIIAFIIGLLNLNKNNNLQRAQYNDFRFGSVRGYGRRRAIRESDFNNNSFIVSITVWIVRLGILYIIFKSVN